MRYKNMEVVGCYAVAGSILKLKPLRRMNLKHSISKVLIVCFLTLSILPQHAPAKNNAPAPNFDAILGLAREMAGKPFVDDRRPLPAKLSELNYDQLRDIRYNPKESVWRRERLPFQLQFFHPGGLNRDQIGYYLVDGDDVKEFPYDSDLFDYGANKLGWMDLRHLKFSGLRIHYPLNTPEYLDELAVFLGSTYFRALPAGLLYGLSARAITINCGGESPEEFPIFKDMWIFRPGIQGNQIQVIGLFDSPSLAGVSSFVIRPGKETVMDARVAVIARTNLTHYGFAPLTSMFWFGKNGTRRFDDYRPEVHDSDGLLMQNGKNEWLWRPLENDGRVRLNSYEDINPKGFGLFQRERTYAAYQDLEANYHRRPSAWICPSGDWGKGRVKLLELPTGTEFQDNIVVFWEPERALAAGNVADFAYQVRWLGEHPSLPELGRTVGMRTGSINMPRARKFVLDYTWSTLAQDVASGAKIEPQVTVTRGLIRPLSLSSEYSPDTRTWRIAFDVIANENEPSVDLRALINKNGVTATETWTYLWMP
jgi:glucans biosynthesis protein